VARAYLERVGRGELVDDPAQRQAAGRLDCMLQEFERCAQGRGGGRGGILAGRKTSRRKSGIYLTGGIGRGKTMLMDMFFAEAPIAQKRRSHFHAFMQEVHGQLFAQRQTGERGAATAAVARAIAAEMRLLCLDEFQVNDITDAMLLGRLFEELMARDVFIVATSNTEPRLLYKDGRNRQLFLPFIQLIEARLELVAVAGDTDYRRQLMDGERIYVSPLGEEAREIVRNLWTMLTAGGGEGAMELAVNGRSLKVTRAAHGVARFSFAELCEAPLGPADYLALARHFDTIFIENIPLLGRGREDAKRRMIGLIDTLYDSQVRVVISAAAPADLLAPGVEDFARTASRLQEMQSRSYWLKGRGC
jgi:cell division protein ZapE